MRGEQSRHASITGDGTRAFQAMGQVGTARREGLLDIEGQSSRVTVLFRRPDLLQKTIKTLERARDLLVGS